MPFITVTAVNWYPDNEYKQQWIAFKVRSLYYECVKVSRGISEKIDVKVCFSIGFLPFCGIMVCEGCVFFFQPIIYFF